MFTCEHKYRTIKRYSVCVAEVTRHFDSLVLILLHRPERAIVTSTIVAYICVFERMSFYINEILTYIKQLRTMYT